jgi:hypothetical protein
MRTPPRLTNVVSAVLVGALTVGCGLLPALEPVPDGPLVTVETRGGECFDGPCGGTIAIERDGRVHKVAPAPAQLGRIPEPLRGALDQAIRTADFDRLRATPFSGECPVHVDGQEIIYTFTTSAETVRLASCEVEIDPDDPLYRAVDAALAAARPG